ncbi:EAL domain-containing protein [Rhodoferax sp.]|uniref:sensor domain-containing protein n=1 Tax=Rhodoferax sp. TaxID=50421 RepID=UPI0025F8410B|nr:EAL domain-containing protein [Rhodoferax sp.]
MDFKKRTPIVDSYQEVQGLIEVLHDTEQRLEELTGGEVDAVTNHIGRTIMLRRAQDNLRHYEASKQSAILNALPAHIALLDAQGIIISVNDAWQRFASANVLHSENFGMGLDYLAVCDAAVGDAAFEGPTVAEGIRSVLKGKTQNFSIEYPCHTPTEMRWFALTVTPLADGTCNGVVVMHKDITAKKLDEMALLRFSAAMNAIADAIYLVDRTSMRFLYVNDAACSMRQLSREALLAITPWDTLAVSRAELEQTYDAIVASGVDAKPLEMRQTRDDGSKIWLELRRHAQYSGERWTIVTLVRDITARKKSEDRILRLNRVYAMLSGINALQVRVRNRNVLLKYACLIAVEDGGFFASWMGLVDHSTMKIVPVASHGLDSEFLVILKDRMASEIFEPKRRSLVTAILGGKSAVVSNDLQNDPKAFFHQFHQSQGIRSAVLLPLMIEDEIVGVFTLYARELDFFGPEEMALLKELSGDIAFAIDHIDKQDRLNYLAYFDALTGLANRHLFLERVTQHMRSASTNNQKLAVFLVDLEGFKNINDSFGQAVGDALLKQVAGWLTRNVGDANLVAHIGADHFAVVMPEVTQVDDVARALEKAKNEFLEHAFNLSGALFRIAAKVGVAVFPDDGASADILLKYAEAALKKAKVRGDRYLFYTQKMTESVLGKLTLENQLRQALDKEEFVLYYQPKIQLGSGKLTGVEALIRWNDPRTGLVPPGQFIPILEETGLIYEVGRWALDKAIADHLRWRNAGLPAVRIAVNVSPLQLRHRGFIAEIRRAVGHDGQAAAGLELEITESLLMEDINLSIDSLQTIRAMGVSIAIDDFGTGFSSLSYLSRLPVDTLKIDRSFVVEMTAGRQGLALVSTIIDLAHAMQLKVVAEGVETEEQSRLLQALNCDELQGFLFSKPIPVDLFETRFLSLPR